MPSLLPPSQSGRSVSTEEIIVGEHLAELRGRIRLLTWISGLGWTLLVLLGGLLVSGTLDWLIHFDDSGTRLVIGLAIFSGSAWMLWRQLIAPLRQQLTGSFLASRVEGRFPGLKSRVLSAVEFLEHRLDARQGSTELQKAVIGQALKDLERIQPSDIVETKAIQKVSIGGALVFALTALIVLLRPLDAATSVQRLVFPFSNVPWPRATELQLVQADLSPLTQKPDQPMLIARGDTLELYVQNSRGRLPERVWFEYRLGDEGPLVRESLRQTTLRDAKGQVHEAAIINWVAARGTMLFRASGGDDQVMPFYKVEVVPPPDIDTLQVTLTPPAYSRRPTEVLPTGVGHIQGLLGTKVEIQATCDKPLQSAKLRIGEKPALPLELGDNRQQFTATFVIADALASSYWFELTDLQGFTDHEAVRYELRGIADGVPDVNIELPATDVMLTADAELPVKILAKDDLELSQVRISYQVGDDENLRTIPLLEPAATTNVADPHDNSATGTGPSAEQPGPQRHAADYTWKMVNLNVESGTRIVFRAEATDRYNLGMPHVGKSTPRTITIISRDDKKKELASRVGDLLDDLKQATQLQQRARQQTEELQTQVEKVGELRSQDIDQLQRTELDQRQTAARLSNPADGVESQARQLLDELRANHLDDAGTEQRLDRLANELSRLERDELPDAERALTRAQKFAEGASTKQNQDSQSARNGDQQKSPNRSGSSSNTGPKAPRKPNAGHQNEPRRPSAAKKPGSDRDETKRPQDPADSDDQSRSESPGDQGLPADPAETGNNASKPKQSSSNADKKSDSGKPSAADVSESPGAPESKTGEATPEKSEQKDADQAKDQSTPEQPGSEKPGLEQPRPEQPDGRSDDQKALQQALAEAQAQQTRSLETLQELQDSLSEWRDRRDVSQDLSSVIAEQEKVQKDAAELARRTLSKSTVELSKQDQAELKKLSERQSKVAEQLDKFNKQLEQTANSLQKHDPETAERFNEVDQQLKNKQTAGRLQEAAQHIASNDIGEAADAQQQALDELRDLERMMKRQPNEDTEQVLKQTDEAQQEFRQLREQQQQLADQTSELAQQPDSPEKREQLKEMQEQQEELSDRLAKAERKLERLRLRGAAEAAHRARKRLNEMMKNMTDADDAEEMQQAMDEALDDLEQVERELVLEKRLVQERLAFEQLEKMEDELKALRSRQETVITETERLDTILGERDGLTRGQAKTLLELAETERSLQHTAEQMQQQMASAEVFSLVLKRLARTLHLAADRLGERQTNAPVQALEKDAIHKIDNLLDVLKQDKQKPDKPKDPADKPEELGQEPQEQEQKPEEAQPPGESISQIAQLKLLKALQEDCLARTELLNSFRDKQGNLPEAMEVEMRELALEQSELADYARNLIAKFLQKQPDSEDGHQPQHDKPKEDKPKEPDNQKEKDPTKIDL